MGYKRKQCPQFTRALGNLAFSVGGQISDCLTRERMTMYPRISFRIFKEYGIININTYMYVYIFFLGIKISNVFLSVFCKVEEVQFI